MVINPTPRIYIQSIVTDNSNSSYPDCIKLIYWKLICQDGMFKGEMPLTTRFDLDMDNFSLLENIDTDTLETWIKTAMGSKYDNLVEQISNSIKEENSPPEPSDTIKYYTYNTNQRLWQSQ